MTCLVLGYSSLVLFTFTVTISQANFTGLMFAAYHNHVDVAAAFIDGKCDLDCASCYVSW